jgi:hypothetical protein
VTRLLTVAIPAGLVVLSMLTAVLAGTVYATPVNSSDRWPLAKPDPEQIDGKALNALFADLVTEPAEGSKGHRHSPPRQAGGRSILQWRQCEHAARYPIRHQEHYSSVNGHRD